MDDLVAFGGKYYGIYWGLLVLARGMDFFSTWVATPNLVLEANPIAKKMGWKWGAVVNLTLCTFFALWPLPAIVISTTSILVAARNFQSAWLMRTLGEHQYRGMVVEHMEQASFGLYLVCLLFQTALLAGLGAGLMYFSDWRLVPFAVGMGIVTYALAVGFYSWLSARKCRKVNASGKPTRDD